MPKNIINLGICKISINQVLLFGGATDAHDKSSNNAWCFNLKTKKKFRIKENLLFEYAGTYGCELGIHDNKIYFPVDGSIKSCKKHLTNYRS